MDSFDFFGETLFDEAKRLYENACESKYNKEEQLYLQSSLLMAMCALEGYVNSVCEELTQTEEYRLDLFGRSLLSEKKIELNSGIAMLGNQLQMSRLTDRIEYIYCRFSGKPISSTDAWHNGVCDAIRMRNQLVHPKTIVTLTRSQVELSLVSVLQTINALFNAIYKRNVPILNYGLQSVKNYKE